MTAASAALRFVLPRALNLFFGLIYPAWFSLAAVESSNTVDDTQWLVYWLIFSLVQIAETCLWPALQWVPFYLEAKAVFLAWLLAVRGRAGAREHAPQGRAHQGARAGVPGQPCHPGRRRRRGRADARAGAGERGAAQGAAGRHGAGGGGGLPGRLGADLRRANGPLPGRAAGIQDARARSRAERTWGKDLSRLAKLASARQSGAAPSGFHLGHRAHAS